jgi:hypothetical protein
VPAHHFYAPVFQLLGQFTAKSLCRKAPDLRD